MDNLKEFGGVKIALLNGEKVVVSLRDNKPGLSYAGMWDLPGGGKESDETPIACIKREVYEELNISLDEKEVIWTRYFPQNNSREGGDYFMVATINQQNIDSIVLGNEGQTWKLMAILDFIIEENAVPQLKERLAQFLKTPEGKSYLNPRNLLDNKFS